ncbi:vitamin-D-receptor interacting mediator subunit 4-domain-containing protein [Paraphysoderma sedebokerense]|nr:vitamin-D-receptor interacting mediator subunit 4-domain-containing protein [Paraphysoderma sedebokerense]
MISKRQTDSTSEIPPTQNVAECINSYISLSQSLFKSIESLADADSALPKLGPRTQNSDDFGNPPDILAEIIQLDFMLQNAMDDLSRHQSLQQKIQHLENQISVENLAVMNLIHSLSNAESELEIVLDKAKRKLTSIKEAEECTLLMLLHSAASKTNCCNLKLASVPYQNIISYANKISGVTSAPPNFNPQNPFVRVQPPYPTEMMMRSGLLYQQGGPATELEAKSAVDSRAAASSEIAKQSTITSTTTPSNEPDEEIIELDFDLNP